MTVGELDERMTSEELVTWIARSRTHIPESWYQVGQICYVIACCFTSKPPSFESFLPRLHSKVNEPMSEEQMKQNLAMALA